MKLAFIMPSEAQKQKIDTLQECIAGFRPDQVAHLEHLLRSWGIFGRPDGLALAYRAMKRTLRDRP